ncbi:unnamed protein product [Mytilus coruscus]|uniref:Uncharacterized protein n=1 Tax=Mytilus coruscus TaxID=42192 RepID=A0A6J8AGJ5_MYTCO|nr:unnamed protein product [Mytilus coruscus]
MGRYQESYGSLLIPLILNKLPCFVRQNITRDHGNDDLDISSLRKAIKKEICIQEAANANAIETDIIPTASFVTETTNKRWRSTGYRDSNGNVVKFVKNCQKKRPYRLRSSQGDKKLRTILTKEDISLAMNLWIKDTQQDRIITTTEMHNDKHNANIQELDIITANKLFERKGLLLDHFAKRWSNEYLTGLREYHRASGKHNRQVNIGDVVQLGSQSARILWRL